MAARYPGFAHVCEKLWMAPSRAPLRAGEERGPFSGGPPKDERQPPLAPGPSQLPPRDGHGPAGVGQVVHEEHRPRHRREPLAQVLTDDYPLQHTRQPEGAVAARMSGGPAVGESQLTEIRQPAEARQAM